MKKISFTAELDIGNAAFEGLSPKTIMLAVLKDIQAKMMMTGEEAALIIDANGNKVGEWSIDLPEEDEGDL